MSQLFVCSKETVRTGNDISEREGIRRYKGESRERENTHCFLTAYKSLGLQCILARTSDSKNPDLYFCCWNLKQYCIRHSFLLGQTYECLWKTHILLILASFTETLLHEITLKLRPRLFIERVPPQVLKAISGVKYNLHFHCLYSEHDKQLKVMLACAAAQNAP